MSVALTAVKVASAAIDIPVRKRRGVVILLYHRVGGGSDTQMDLTPELFCRQMESLAAQDRVVSLDHALDIVASGTIPSHDPIVVTFDDGTRDVVDRAFPILERLRLPSTLYLATRFVDEQVCFPHRGRPASWQGIADMVSTGLVTVASHTHSHAVCGQLSVARARYELDRSVDLIGSRLGLATLHFAYPKAVLPSRECEREIRTRFRSAALGGCRANPYGATDPHRLSRSPVQRADGMTWFARKALGGMWLEGSARAILDRRRYAHAAS